VDAQRLGKQILFDLGSLKVDYIAFKSSWGKLLVGFVSPKRHRWNTVHWLTLQPKWGQKAEVSSSNDFFYLSFTGCHQNVPGVALRVAAVIYAYFSQSISATSSRLNIPRKLEKRDGNLKSKRKL